MRWGVSGPRWRASSGQKPAETTQPAPDSRLRAQPLQTDRFWGWLCGCPEIAVFWVEPKWRNIPRSTGNQVSRYQTKIKDFKEERTGRNISIHTAFICQEFAGRTTRPHGRVIKFTLRRRQQQLRSATSCQNRLRAGQLLYQKWNRPCRKAQTVSYMEKGSNRYKLMSTAKRAKS
jgi:hypothetical protein